MMGFTSFNPFYGPGRLLLLLLLRAGEPDHLAPLVDLLGHEAAEVGGGPREHDAAEIGEPCLQLRIGERGIDLRVELRDDFRRRALRRCDAMERARLVARNELG